MQGQDKESKAREGDRVHGGGAASAKVLRQGHAFARRWLCGWSQMSKRDNVLIQKSEPQKESRGSKVLGSPQSFHQESDLI